MNLQTILDSVFKSKGITMSDIEVSSAIPTATLSQLLDQAVSTLGPVRRNWYKRLLKNSDIREGVLDGMAAKLFDAHEAGLIVLPEVSGPNFSSSTSIAVNPDNLKKLLDLIIQYLPQILALILQLFPKN